MIQLEFSFFALFSLISRLAWRSSDNLCRLSGQDAVVVLRLEARIDEDWHAVAQDVQSALAVDFEIVGENERVTVGVDQALVLGLELFVDVPAADGVAVDLSVEDRVRLFVVEFSG